MIMLISGCATGLKTTILSDSPIETNSREFVFLSRTEWDNDLRAELIKKGFKVKKFAVLKTEIEKSHSKDTIKDAVEAKYGLTMKWSQVDRCLINDSIKGNFYIEISDLQNNEVIATIKNGGWTSSCAYHGLTSVFTELAVEFHKLWFDRNQPLESKTSSK